VQPAENPFKTKPSYMSVMKNQLKNLKSQLERAKIPSENPKTQFDTGKTQFENVKTKKTAQVLAQVFLDRHKSPGIPQENLANLTEKNSFVRSLFRASIRIISIKKPKREYIWCDCEKAKLIIISTARK